MTDRIKIVGTEIGKFADLFPEGWGVSDGYCVIAITAAGENYIHQRRDLDEDDAKNLAKTVKLAGQITPDYWVFWRTIYGSEAYLAEEAEAAHAAQMIRGGMAHEEDFAGTSIGELL